MLLMTCFLQNRPNLGSFSSVLCTLFGIFVGFGWKEEKGNILIEFFNVDFDLILSCCISVLL